MLGKEVELVRVCTNQPGEGKKRAFSGPMDWLVHVKQLTFYRQIDSLFPMYNSAYTIFEYKCAYLYNWWTIHREN